MHVHVSSAVPCSVPCYPNHTRLTPIGSSLPPSHPPTPQVQGQSSRHYLPFHKVIYVMEDVDAASHVVQRRAPDQQSAGAGALAGPASAPLVLDKVSEEEAAAAQVCGWRCVVRWCSWVHVVQCAYRAGKGS
jgi:hypothetical protein